MNMDVGQYVLALSEQDLLEYIGTGSAKAKIIIMALSDGE